MLTGALQERPQSQGAASVVLVPCWMVPLMPLRYRASVDLGPCGYLSSTPEQYGTSVVLAPHG